MLGNVGGVKWGLHKHCEAPYAQNSMLGVWGVVVWIVGLGTCLDVGRKDYHVVWSPGSVVCSLVLGLSLVAA